MSVCDELANLPFEKKKKNKKNNLLILLYSSFQYEVACVVLKNCLMSSEILLSNLNV